MLDNLLVSFMSLSLTTKIIMIVVWTIIVIGAIIIETETAELVSVWFALGGIVCLILALCGVDIYIQLIVFSVVSVFFIIVTRPIIKKFAKNDDIPTNADRLKGMIAVVTKDIFAEEKGEVKVNYQIWTAICKSGYEFKIGDKVVVLEIEGNKLIVGKIEEIEIK